jgi:hypothetical protein
MKNIKNIEKVLSKDEIDAFERYEELIKQLVMRANKLITGENNGENFVGKHSIKNIESS